MSTRFTKVLVAAAVCLATASVMAGDSYLDASAKMRGDFGNINRGSMNSGMVYRWATPQDATVAQAPAETRRFSYEPSQPAKENVQQAAPAAPRTAQQPQAQRRFSYDPGTTGATMNYGAARRSSSPPLYALPRTDSRKLGGS